MILRCSLKMRRDATLGNAIAAVKICAVTNNAIACRSAAGFELSSADGSTIGLWKCGLTRQGMLPTTFSIERSHSMKLSLKSPPVAKS